MNIEQLNKDLELAKIKSQTVAIAGKLKTLWRSLSIDDTGNDESLFTSNLGDGGDSYIVETLINDVASLHKALSGLEIVDNSKVKNVTSIELKSLETESNLVKEHYDVALKAHSLAMLLDKSHLFAYLWEPESQAIAGSLELLFSQIEQLHDEADRLYCQSIKK
ncbi:hypothetical protein Syn7502_02279 [Synechococcus sp. PCC 7502]|uniref:hypothetical protein n=1 Tax=Synechococcus sp. PCC 7502 TaxID=1173263 RepID=UPI00029FA863|nr:hypothetical protein [Synechococcus sp. PCC 7502]AFY74284.1 hypothetical protein Syn7502_02279 [Synechococcus sp. PCC 7502]